MRAKNIVTALIMLQVAAWGAGAGEQVYPCYRALEAPIIDGEVEGDPVWQHIPGATGFRRLGGGYTEVKQTVARACWDDEAFYVSMVCEEPDAAQLKPTIKDWGETWLEDSVEIFVQPEEKGQVYQFGVTAGGAKGGWEGTPDVARCAAAAKIGTNSYSIEIRIPYEVLKTRRPENGRKWRGTFCRNIFTTKSGGDKFTNWSPLQSRFLEPENFATIVFVGNVLALEEARAVEEEINREYRQVIAAQLREASAEAPEYRKVLQEAAEDPVFGDQARALLRQWWRIDRLSRHSASAPLLDLRNALTQTRAAAAASHELKYRYLIHRLFAD
jgi:hypothetical protein